MPRLGLGLFGVFILMLSCGARPDLKVEGLSRYQDERISEPSGLVKSRQWPGLFWTHNDSGDSSRIFAVSADGSFLVEYQIEGAEAVDWEDIATDNSGWLYIADIGNNKSKRRDLKVYRVKEPNPREESARRLKVDREIRFRFPEQQEFPDKKKRFDTEALFWVPGAGEGKLFLLSKRRGDMKTVLYRFEGMEGEVLLSRLGEFELGGDPLRFGGMVTAADASPDGERLAVLTYHALFLFERAEDDNYLSKPLKRIDFNQLITQQAEAIAWDGEAIIFTNEQGQIFRLKEPLKLDHFPPSQKL